MKSANVEKYSILGYLVDKRHDYIVYYYKYGK